jgi:predicted nucleotidyltransferase
VKRSSGPARPAWELVQRITRACTARLPDATAIVHGSLALGGYRPGESDVDLLVLSDAPTDGLVETVEREWALHPIDLDLRVITYSAAAAPTRAPLLSLYVSLTAEHGLHVERDVEEPDLVIELSLCRQLGHSDVIGHVPDEWVDEVGAAAVARWQEIGYDPPHQELMALTACRIWRFREERVHCSKLEAAAWARERGARVAFDEASVRELLERA